MVVKFFSHICQNPLADDRLNDIDQVFLYLDKAFQNRSPNLVDEICVDPVFNAVRHDQRFIEFLKKMKIDKFSLQ